MATGTWKRTNRLIGAAWDILKVEQPMTLRQLFYRLVSVEVIRNTTGDYQRLSRVTSRAREREEIPFEWIVDRSRPEYSPCVFENPDASFRFAQSEHRKNYWSDQPEHVEIWTEKDSLTGSIADVTNKLGLTVSVSRGFMSASRAYEIASRFSRIQKPIHVLYLGDHDPSGRCIETEMYDRVRDYGSGDFKMRRLAIHAADIKKFNLPPLRIKTADPRAGAFFAKHGADCVEVDAVPPTELRRRISAAVVDLMDMDRWDRAVQVEKVELASMKAFVDTWPTFSAKWASRGDLN